MIVTVTPAPAVDWTVTLQSFEWEAVNRMSGSEREPSGKGVNVSVALARAGRPTLAVFPGGGDSGAFMSRSLTALGVDHVMSASDSDVRTNVTLTLPDGRSTKINEPGAELSLAALDRMRRSVSDALSRASALVVGGSLPPGVAPEFVAELVRTATDAGVPAIVDSSRGALVAALSAGPALIKPNVHELANLTDRELRTVGDVAEAARSTMDRGTRALLVSLGADGALYVDRERMLFGAAMPTRVVNTVGAGDALLAGFLGGEPNGLAGDPAVRLARGLAWAAAAVAHPTTQFPVPGEGRSLPAVAAADPSRALSEPGTPGRA